MNITDESNGWISASQLTEEELNAIASRQIKPAQETVHIPTDADIAEFKREAKQWADLFNKKAKSLSTSSSPKAQDSHHKVPVNLCPASAIIAIALVIAQGHKKPGRTIYNWRTQPIGYMSYMAACQRHILKAQDGENFDEELSQLASDGQKTPEGEWTIQVRHDWAAMSCLAIIEDARQAGTLVDDRPVKGGASQFLQSLTKENK